ncbi:MAG: mevalonate kinase [Gammaproteobacteria bacterium]
MSYDFTATAHAKWILAGEHAVLRGYPALLFPISSRSATLDYIETQQPAHFTCEEQNGEHLIKVIRDVIYHGLRLLNLSNSALTGHFIIHNNVALGAGMGGSAVLCATVSRWFAYRNYIKQDELFNFAHQLENLFHGESSGADVAISLFNQSIIYRRNCPIEYFQPAWQPIWYLSNSEQHAPTANCIAKVKQLHAVDPAQAQQIDQDMQYSVELAITALQSTDQTIRLKQLCDAIHLANSCFIRWNLTTGRVPQHLQRLLQAGALACKPTGAGDGGYILSLWEKPLTPEMLNQLPPLIAL